MTPTTLDTCCTPVTSAVLDEEAAVRIAGVFKALGDPGRLRLLSMIAAAQSGEACACDLVEIVGLSQPTVSHHLALLVEAGLVKREKRGKWAWYRIVPEQLNLLRDVLRPAVPSVRTAFEQPPPPGAT